MRIQVMRFIKGILFKKNLFVKVCEARYEKRESR